MGPGHAFKRALHEAGLIFKFTHLFQRENQLRTMVGHMIIHICSQNLAFCFACFTSGSMFPIRLSCNNPNFIHRHCSFGSFFKAMDNLIIKAI